MEEIIQSVLNDYLIPGFITLIGSLLVYGMGHGATWLKEQSGNTKVKGAIDWVHTLARQAVLEQEQIAVKHLKINGDWGLEGQQKVKAKAREVLERHLGENGMKLLQARFGHKGEDGKKIVQGMLDSAIEMAVAEMNGKSPGIPFGVSDAPTASLES